MEVLHTESTREEVNAVSDWGKSVSCGQRLQQLSYYLQLSIHLQNASSSWFISSHFSSPPSSVCQHLFETANFLAHSRQSLQLSSLSRQQIPRKSCVHERERVQCRQSLYSPKWREWWFLERANTFPVSLLHRQSVQDSFLMSSLQMNFPPYILAVSESLYDYSSIELSVSVCPLQPAKNKCVWVWELL